MVKEKQQCQLALTKPTVENVIPYTQYKKTQPQFNNESTDDLLYDNNGHHLILFGGGRDLVLTLLNTTSTATTSNAASSTTSRMENVELFILNSSIVLWFGILGHGLEIPYTSCIYHGTKSNNHERDGHKLEILLTLERDPILNEFFPRDHMEGTTFNYNNSAGDGDLSSIELLLKPKYSTYDRHYNQEIETLFTFENFGINRGDELVLNCHEALSLGMEVHGSEFEDTDNDDEDNTELESEAVFTGLSGILKSQNTYLNAGLADDLDGDSTMDNVFSNDNYEAGMSMEFYNNQPATGRKNPRSDHPHL
ncbi:Lot5p NDAI_0D04560 [Naumovozyma dairenensis CBS 421]|uniref:Protein LOT5 n=1 Tax=Naumovozyma dairenensis (strain ATCC 10597 / BCRC 20456 / CBS 421 / NBRC 0211 / NRRL Y-12639) TaxID=1071378 RepID=G0WAF8_NAUDC|nr:hypothetical protein NDAI_0D04560 [Naumovozyma dairenensis CBS 421]CCD24769.1 hypothetical protein NDAI_0D04560 [Naumovozyma dairenensis CBS 421]